MLARENADRKSPISLPLLSRLEDAAVEAPAGAGASFWTCGRLAVALWRVRSEVYARAVPVRNHFYAHCRICGNLELQRIAAERVPGMISMFWRVLRIPALRCEPCRHKFFSVKPLMREERRVEATPVK